MISLSAILLSAPLLAGLSSDVGVSADVNLSAGQMALDFDVPTEPAMMLTYGLQGGLRVRSRRGTWIVALGPQWTFQVPNVVEVDRPLLLYRGQTSFSYRLSRRVTYEASVGGQYGELSYSNSSQYFDPGTNGLRTSFQKILALSASTGLAYRASRSHQLAVSLSAGHSDTVDDGLPEGAPESAGVPGSYSAGLTLSDTYTASPIDELTFSLNGGYTGVLTDGDAVVANTGGDFLVAGGTISYRRTLSERSSVSLTGGGAATYGTESERADFIPEANFAHTYSFRVGEWNSAATSAGGVRGFFDQTTARYLPQGFASLGLGGEKNRTYLLGLNLFGSTSLSATIIDPPAYETLANASLQFGYRVSRFLSLSLGARYGLRAPHLEEEDGLLVQQETVGFFGIRGNWGTDTSAGSWVP